jgi:hypothetical protein
VQSKVEFDYVGYYNSRFDSFLKYQQMFLDRLALL